MNTTPMNANPMNTPQLGAHDIASVNGVVLSSTAQSLGIDELRQRAYSELLRQEAIQKGLLAATDLPAADGVLSEAASAAIERLLDQALNIPEPSEEACRRHYQALASNYTTGERIEARHILFAVTQGTDVVALRNRAETTLLDVRCHGDGRAGAGGQGSADAFTDGSLDAFAKAARTMSNCPSGAEGGDLGWLTRAECAPEFARELFGRNEVGVLPRLVHSRFGLHVVEVLRREPGIAQPFEAVHGAVRMSLRQQTYVTALRQYLQLLAGKAEIFGVDVQAATTPLVQ